MAEPRTETIETEAQLRLIAADPQGTWTIQRGRWRGGSHDVLAVVGRVPAGGAAPKHEAWWGTDHPNLGHILAEDWLPGGFVLLLQDPGGSSLATLRGAPQPPAVVLELAEGMAAGLAAVHAAGRVHGRLELDSYVLDAATGAPVLVELIALALPTSGDDAWTGRPVPELGAGALDARSDLYLLGTILYELLTGRPAIVAADPLERHHLALAGRLVAPRALNTDVPEGLSQLVLRLLSPEPTERYPSAAALLHDLGRARHLLAERGNIPPLTGGTYDRGRIVRMPEGVIGREADRRALADALGRAAAGASLRVELRGNAGIGKTTLVETLRSPTLARGGCFGLGRFDPVGAPRPFGALAGALDEIAAQILAGDTARLERVRRAIARGLGPNGPLIATLGHRISCLVPNGGARQRDEGVAAAAARLVDALERFVVAIAEANPPLVLALDDFHRADAETLALVRALAHSPAARHLLVLVAWRADEAAADLVEPDIPSDRILRMELGPLPAPALAEVLAAALGDLGDARGPLVQLVEQRTKGNPLFVRAYLQELAAAGAIGVDAANLCSVDFGVATAVDVSAGVAAVLVQQLRALPGEVRTTLAVGARFGGTFPERLLAEVLSVPPAAVAARLAEAAEAGVVAAVPDAEDSVGEWRFLHDRLHEAAHDLLDAHAGAVMHARLGAILTAGLGPEPAVEPLLRAVHQRNLGSSVLRAAEERDELARWNLRASRMARGSGAFGAALGFVDVAIALLGTDPWRLQEEATQLHLEGARAAILAAPDRVDAYLHPLLGRMADPVQAAENMELRVDLHLARNDAPAALGATREALRRLGYRLPDRVGKGHIAFALLRAQLALSGRSREALLTLPDVTDPRQAAVLRVMLRGSTAAYLADPDLFAYLACEMMRVGLAAGACPGTAWGLLVFAILRSAGLGDLEGGYGLGDVARRMLERFAPHGLNAKAGSVWFATQVHTHHPLRESLAPLRELFREGLAEGDPLHAGICAAFYLNHLVFSGEPLDRVVEEMRRIHDEMQLRQQDLALETSEPFRQLARCMRGEIPAEEMLSGAVPDKPFQVFTIHFCRCVLSVLAGRDAEALVHARGADPAIEAVRGTVNEPLFLFFAAVAAGRLLARGAAKDRTAARRLRKGLAAMRRRARANPTDFLGRVAHLEALTAWAGGRPLDALGPLDSSVRAARARGAPHEAALALETAEQVHDLLGAPDTGQLLRAAALEAWRAWGATVLIAAATTRLGVDASPTPPVHRTAPGIEVVLRATEALAGDVGRDVLLASLVRLAAMPVGAERVVLCGVGPRDLDVRAVLEDGVASVVDALPLETYGRVCAPAARLASRTGEVVLEADASRHDTFGHHAWVRAAGVRSLLAIPVFLRGALKGVLVLEHGRRTGAFSVADVTPLRVLASVAAALLENAELLSSVEDGATKLRSANAALQEQSRLLEEAVHARTDELDALTRLQASILDALSEGVCGIDATGRVTFANPAAARLLGEAIENLAGTPFHERFHVPDVGDTAVGAEACPLCDASVARQDVPAQLRCGGQGARWVECSVQPIRDLERPGVRVLSFRDVGRRRELEAQLRQSQKMEAIGLFVGGVAHEFNNLLTPILGRMEMAQDTLDADHPIQESLASVERAGRRAADLVRQLLALGRRTEMVARPTDISATVLEALRFVRTSLDRRITVSYEPPAGGVWAMADSGQVHQILLNLCLNARDAIRSDPRTDVAARIDVSLRRIELDAAGAAALHPAARPGSWIELEVADTGPGMTPEVSTHIFEPFFTTKVVGEGSGLGLAVLHGIVQQHGGWVSVRTSPGEGASFVCTFPALEQAPAHLSTPEPRAPGQSNAQHILLVDDEAMVRDVSRSILEHHGYRVDEAEDGRDALARLQGGLRPDLVLLDLVMPGMDGWQTLVRLREIDPTLPVIVLSGFEPSVEPRSVRPDGRLGKPFQVRELLNVVDEVLQHLERRAPTRA